MSTWRTSGPSFHRVPIQRSSGVVRVPRPNPLLKGRRPGFVTPSGSYIDEDPLDCEPFQTIVRAQGQVVGCIRLRPLAQDSRTLFAPIMSEPELGAFLVDLGVARNDCLEARALTAELNKRGASLGT
jgi:hypothetical protein